MKENKIYIDPKDDDFGAILNCAVRYALGRRSYMPKLVIDFITPLLSLINSKTLWCFEKDIEIAKNNHNLGDDEIDKPEWIQFLNNIKSERKRRVQNDSK